MELENFLILFLLFLPQQPASSPQGLRQYTRSRREGGARSPAISNALLPILIQDLKLDDVIVQVGNEMGTDIQNFIMHNLK